MRIPFIKEKNVEDFEFSQGYLFFWDKIERSNYFLNTIADIYRRTPKEDVGGRLVSCLLGNPICDGGQWDMWANLIKKYGVIPQAEMSESFSSSQSSEMNKMLSRKLRENAHDLRKKSTEGFFLFSETRHA